MAAGVARSPALRVLSRWSPIGPPQGSGPAASVFDIHRCAQLEQGTDRFDIAVSNRHVKCGHAAPVRGVEPGASLVEQANLAGPSRLVSPADLVYRGDAVARRGHGIGIRTGIEKKPGDLQMADPCCPQERRHRAAIGIGTRVEQGLDLVDARVPVSGVLLVAKEGDEGRDVS